MKTDSNQPPNTKKSDQLEEPSGAYEASADHQATGMTSSTRRDHQITSELIGEAGDPPQGAGHGA
jgi:hypothetical protein